MRILIHKITLIALFSVFFIAEMAVGQPERARERIQQMKKMKLLDVLKLEEAQADKFIVKYSSWENKIEAQKDKVDEATEALFDLLKNKGKTEDISNLSHLLLLEREKFMDIQGEKLKAMKEVLDEVQYAKYLVFEHRFLKELGRMMMKGGRRGPPGGMR